MKLNLLAKAKIALIAILAVVVAGVTLLAIFGLNDYASYGDAYEVHVKVQIDVADHVETIKEVAKKELKAKGYSVLDYTVLQEYGSESIFTVNKEVSEEVVNSLQAKVEEKISTADFPLDIEVKAYESNGVHDTTNYVQGLLAVLGAIVVYCVYLMFRQKFVSAFTVALATVCEGVTFMSLMALTRVCVTPAVNAVLMASLVMTVVLASVYTGKAKELTKKHSENEKATATEIATLNENANVCATATLSAIALAFALMFVVIGTATMRWLGLAIIVATVSVAANALFLLPATYVCFKNVADKKKNKFAYKATESTSNENK